MWKSVQAALELDEPFDVGIPIELTDELEPARARELLATTRAEPGWCALLVDAGANHLLGELAGAERVRAALADYERASPVIARASAEPIEQALTRLGEVTGMDPLAVLHRLEGDTLGAIEGDDVEFDADMLLPEASPRDAYAAFVAARAEARAARVGFVGLVLEQATPPRTYDVTTALTELAVGRARVVRLATTPARAMLYLGFGGWNSCPGSSQQARIWEHWAIALGAEPVVLGEATLDAIVARPISTRAQLVDIAREVVEYDPDSVIEGYLPMLAMLYRNANLRFWWD